MPKVRIIIPEGQSVANDAYSVVYLVFSWKDSKNFQSRTISKNPNPKFGSNYVLSSPNQHAVHHPIELRLYKKRGRDEHLIGQLQIPLHSFQRGKLSEFRWYPLMNSPSPNAQLKVRVMPIDFQPPPLQKQQQQQRPVVQQQTLQPNTHVPSYTGAPNQPYPQQHYPQQQYSQQQHQPHYPPQQHHYPPQQYPPQQPSPVFNSSPVQNSSPQLPHNGSFNTLPGYTPNQTSSPHLPHSGSFTTQPGYNPNSSEYPPQPSDNYMGNQGSAPVDTYAQQYSPQQHNPQQGFYPSL